MHRLVPHLAVLLPLMTSLALAQDPPEDCHVLVRHEEWFQGGGTILTLWSDGYVEEVALEGGPRRESHHLSGRVPETALSQIRSRVEASGLGAAEYTQRPDPSIASNYSTSFEVWNGRALHSIQRPSGLVSADASTSSLDERIDAFLKALREAIAPHLETQGAGGTYACAQLVSPEPAESDLKDLPEGLRAALLRPGAYVLLPPGAAGRVRQGQRATYGAVRVLWVVGSIRGPSPLPDASGR